MRRVAIFAHFDPKNTIKRYILRHLAALREVCDEIHFASTSSLNADELGKLEGLVASHRLGENAGYDFGMWGRIIADLRLDGWDELLLTNSSVYGPLKPLAGLFAHMDTRTCDFWGLTDSLEMEYHIQSFFLVFRKSVLTSGHVEKFFGSVLPYRNKWQVIRSYEIGLTHYFLDQGFVPAVGASVLGKELRLGVCNPCIFLPARLLDMGVPYVKVELLRDNPALLRLGAVRERMVHSGYPLDLVEVERNPRESYLADLHNRINLQLQRWRIRGRPIIPLRSDVAAMLRSDPSGDRTVQRP
jgi:lipopolysaccharide biosynthesis protein